MRVVIRECSISLPSCYFANLPSDHPAFAKLLVEAGINSISVSPDSCLAVKEHVVDAERA